MKYAIVTISYSGSRIQLGNTLLGNLHLLNFFPSASYKSMTIAIPPFHCSQALHKPHSHLFEPYRV